MIVIQIFQSFQIPFWSRVPPLVQLFFLNLASYRVLPVLPSYSVLIHQPPAQPPLSAPLSCLTLLTWLTELPMSSRPLPPAWLLFMTLQLGVSKPAFPIPAGFPSPNCMSRSHTREGSHRPQKGYCMHGKCCWDWGSCRLLSCGLTPSHNDVKIMSWEEPASVGVLIFSLSTWHKLCHCTWSFHLPDHENPKLSSPK